MKILVITGSPKQNGTTALLADEFCRGAEEANHEIVRFNAAKMDIKSCVGCRYCRSHDGNCVHKDDMMQIYPHLLDADMIVFATPLFYFNMTSQLKKALDRFYAIHNILKNSRKKTCLLASCGNENDWAMDALKAHYNIICNYLQWEDCGCVLAFGCFKREDTEKGPYPKEARSLGQGL